MAAHDRSYAGYRRAAPSRFGRDADQPRTAFRRIVTLAAFLGEHEGRFRPICRTYARRVPPNDDIGWPNFIVADGAPCLAGASAARRRWTGTVGEEQAGPTGKAPWGRERFEADVSASSWACRPGRRPAGRPVCGEVGTVPG